MKRFFKKAALMTSLLSSLAFSTLFADETDSNPKTDSNIELILKEKKNHLGDLLIKRFLVVKKIAYHKWNKKLPIDNEKEEKSYLNELSSFAHDFKIHPHLVEKFFNAQLDAQKAIEIQLFETWVEQDIHTHSVDTNLPSLKFELKNIDIELLKNLEHSKDLVSKNSDLHLTDLANQLKVGGFPREVIDDSLHFMKPTVSFK